VERKRQGVVRSILEKEERKRTNAKMETGLKKDKRYRIRIKTNRK
jgi:hypothetical protein